MNNIQEWYDDPLKFVDATDIDEHGKRAVNVLRDLIVSRNVELGTLRRLFSRALKTPIRLLPSQQRTLELSIQAKQLGENESMYIARQLGISRVAAWYRLQTLEKRLIVIEYQLDSKTLTYDESMAIVSEGATHYDVPMSEIDKTIYHQTAPCPTKNYNDVCTGTAYVRFGLCLECHTYYKAQAGGIPEWVEFIRNDVRTQARQEARHDLMRSEFDYSVR